MSGLVDLLVPLFGLMAAGYGATFHTFFPRDSARVLATFVFHAAIPAFLFRAISSVELPASLDSDVVIAYLAGTATALVAGFLAAMLWTRLTLLSLTIRSFTSGYGNTVLLGAPLAIGAFGDAALLPYMLVMTSESILVFALVILLCEIGSGTASSMTAVFRQIIRGLLFNPVLAAMILGLGANLAGLVLPSTLDRFLEILGGAAIPCALFATGAALRGFTIRGALLPVIVISAIKLLVQPATVYLAGRYVFDLPALPLAVATLTAAMPVGVNAYIFAQRYETGVAESAGAILFSTVMSLATLTAILLFFGAGAGADTVP